MSIARAALVSLAGSLIVVACAGRATDEVGIPETIDASVKGTVEAQASPPPASATPEPSETPLPTSTPVPIASPTSGPLAAMVSVSLATNCRTGPGLYYARVTTIEPGQAVRVTARSSVEDYWYVDNPNEGDAYCWLWGGYATVEGDVGTLPVLTPAASPIPQLDFTLYRHSITECGATKLNLIVVNNSTRTFKSARIHVVDLTTSTDLHGLWIDTKPFADNPSSCPADKGSSSFPPGTTAYIVVPLKTFHVGNDAAAYIALCTGANGDGDCVTKTAYFRLPDE